MIGPRFVVSLAVAAALCAPVLGCTAPEEVPGERAPVQSASAVARASATATLGHPAEPRHPRIDALVEAAIAGGACSGAVVALIEGGEVTYRRAYGDSQVAPERRAMQPDALFDLASLTKPLVTATAIMQLVEAGRLSLGDRVARHLPPFGAAGKGDITVADLLRHTSGLADANHLSQYRAGRRAALDAIFAMEPKHPRGERVYSDLGYIVLGALVEAISGRGLDDYAAAQIFAPLGMRATFSPGEVARAVPTEQRDGVWLVGRVHDPRAAGLGGVAGHAGLFASADDVARFARMLLGGGALDGRRVLSPESTAAMLRLAYLESAGGFGHTGFTGTSLWIHPQTKSGIVLLTSRLHPDGKGDVTALRRDLKNLVFDMARPAHEVRNGIDVLVAEGFARLRGRRVGLIANHTARARDGRRTADLLYRAPEVTLVALFAPEHGASGREDGAVAGGRDEATGLPIHSLYGADNRPAPAQLAGIDTLVFDLQDAGARFYTYATTLGYALEAAAAGGLRVVVLDRPNPIDGVHVQGPLLDAGRESFIGYYRIPVRHGMTLGELARLYNAERHIGADLEVVAMRGWRRSMRFDDTGQLWIDPSPNLRSPAAALLYPGVALVEATNVSVGRGTDTPFALVGAPWIDADTLARDLAGLPGIEAHAAQFTPSASRYAGTLCHGVRLRVTDPRAFDAPALGVAIALSLRRWPRWDDRQLDLLIGHAHTTAAIRRGDPLDAIVGAWRDAAARFAERRAPHLLYP